MAIVAIKVDDFDRTSPATETINFAFDGNTYEIDLNPANAQEFREVITKYTTVARPADSDKPLIAKVSIQEPTPPAGKPATRKRAVAAKSRKHTKSIDRPTTREIRAWAATNGHHVSDRGRIPANVIEAFNQAHGVR